MNEKSRSANDGSLTSTATDWAKPFTISGRSRSMRSRVRAGSSAREHTRVDPAISVPTRL